MRKYGIKINGNALIRTLKINFTDANSGLATLDLEPRGEAKPNLEYLVLYFFLKFIVSIAQTFREVL